MTDNDTDINHNRLQELREFFDSIGLGPDGERDNFLEYYPKREINDCSQYLRTTTVTTRNTDR